MKVEQSTNTVLSDNKAKEKQVTESTDKKQDFSKVLDSELDNQASTFGSGDGQKRPPN